VTPKASLVGLLAGLLVLQSAAQQPAAPAPSLVQVRVLEVSRMMAQMSQEALSDLDYAQLYESCAQKPAPAELAAAPRDKLVVARAMLALMIERRSSPDADVNEWAEQCKQRIMKRMGPRGRYYSSSEFERFQKFGNGFTLGLVLTRFNGEWVVREVLQGQPAASSGIRAGDTLESIDGVRVRDISHAQLLEALSDRADSLATVVWRPLGKPSQSAIIQRGAMTREATLFAQKLPDHVYIRISGFRALTPRELAAALRELQLDSTTKRVLDLRGNPGGLLTEAQWVLAVLGDSNRMKSWSAVKYRPDRPDTKMFSVSGSLAASRGAPQISEEELRAWALSHHWLILTDGETGSGAAWLASVLRELNDAVLAGQAPDPNNFGVDTIRPVKEAGGMTGMRYEIGQLALPSGQVLAGTNTAPDLPLRQTLEIIRPYPKSAADWLQDPVYAQIKSRLGQ
jgi:carboxyl-terminal processing protease